MKKAYLGAIVPLFSLVLAACTPTVVDDYNFKIISPIGAPTITLVDFDEKLDTNDNPQNVAASFMGSEYDVVVFDMINGLRNINKNDAPFKLYYPLTSGNYYLVSLNKEEVVKPTASDKVVVFAKDSTGDFVFQNLYPGVTATYVNAVSDAAAVALSGLYEGEAVDYVLLAQPVLTNVLNNSKQKPLIVDHFGSSWNTKYNQIIPQAGLFIRNTAYEAHQGVFDSFLVDLKAGVASAKNDVASVLAKLNTMYPVAQELSAKYGFAPALINGAYTKTPNPFGLIESSELSKVDIAAFVNNLNLPAINQNLIKF